MQVAKIMPTYEGMGDPLAESVAATIEHFERRERQLSKGGYAATQEFAVACRAWAVPVSDAIKAKRQSDIARLVRDLDPEVVAVAGLSSLAHSIVIEREDAALPIDIGRAVQGELFAAGLLSKQVKALRKAKTARGRTKL